MKDQGENTKKTTVKPKRQKTSSKVEEVPDDVREIVVEKRSGFNTLEVIIIMIIAILFGALIGSAVTYSREKQKSSTGLEMISDDLEEFVDTYHNILDNYYLELDQDELLNAGIKGMIEYLNDSHSTYMDAAESEAFNEQVEGSYVGIGAEMTLLNDTVKISYLFDGSPAGKAGIQVGDIIQQVDGTDIQGKALSDISALIKGTKGTTVKITVTRGEETLDFVVVRDKVELTSVTSKVFERNNQKIGYLDIDIFASNTSKQFKTELEKLEKESIDRLIIDVRDNPGGHLTQVSEMLAMILKKGDILYQIETKGIKEPTYDWTKEQRDYEIAVLINHASASASEILASALNEIKGSEIIGITSYGKGTVQKAFELKSGATIKYTTQKWLTPKGNWIDGVGVKPTVEVELDDAYYENPTDEMDNQLQKAIEILANK